MFNAFQWRAYKLERRMQAWRSSSAGWNCPFIFVLTEPCASLLIYQMWTGLAPLVSCFRGSTEAFESKSDTL